MVSPQTLWQKKRPSPVLLGVDTSNWIARTQQRLVVLTAAPIPQTVLLNLSDPLEFLAGFMAACLAGCPIFLGNPAWSTEQWQQVIALAQPQLIWSDTVKIPPPTPLSSVQPSSAQPGWIMIPTGGSTGTIRFAIHTWSTLLASVKGFHEHFHLDTINACCVLPLYHVSGLMQFMRTFVTGGQLAILPFRHFCSGLSPEKDLAALLEPHSHLPQNFCLSLVPTQLQRLYQYPERLPWLARFQMILLGGAPPWPQLLETARQHHLRLAPTYGMTETASQVVTLPPAQFLQGNTSSGQVLPHAQVTLQLDSPQAASPDGKPDMGTIAIQAQSLCLGYYPTLFAPDQPFITDDVGYFDEHDQLHVVGRTSRKIISGGENIYPEPIEAAILMTQRVADVVVVGWPDPDWGEAVTAVYVPNQSTVEIAQLQAAMADQVSRYQMPKRWIAVDAIPRNDQGKIDPHRLKRLIATFV